MTHRYITDLDIDDGRELRGSAGSRQGSSCQTSHHIKSLLPRIIRSGIVLPPAYEQDQAGRPKVRGDQYRFHRKTECFIPCTPREFLEMQPFCTLYQTGQVERQLALALRISQFPNREV